MTDLFDAQVHGFIRVSSRFRRTLATAVHAARSGTEKVAGGGSFTRREETVCCLAQRADNHFNLRLCSGGRYNLEHGS
jgi:hypothetical protein